MILNSVSIQVLLVLHLLRLATFCQDLSSISTIIHKIYELEKGKDPKCYAPANRLEDFMFGTPLNEDARNLKIEIHKEIIYYLKKKVHKKQKKKEAKK
ncbi:MAG: hypothetical protein ACJAQX_000100 [Polaribacter sp.]|jgi:hypothetical protein|uniref:hypothetical protein n=1 Tax=Polaribacter sp. TaxID=1920175 RepID=UPI003ACCBEC7